MKKHENVLCRIISCLDYYPPVDINGKYFNNSQRIIVHKNDLFIKIKNHEERNYIMILFHIKSGNFILEETEFVVKHEEKSFKTLKKFLRSFI